MIEIEPMPARALCNEGGLRTFAAPELQRLLHQIQLPR